VARHEADREDLMAEATALRRRVEFFVDGQPEPIVAGIRDGSHWSVYFGPDPVYHFDAAGALRRAYVGGCLYRSQGTTLAQLDRVRTGDEVVLQRRDLTPAELEGFVSDMLQRLQHLQKALESGAATIVRQVPEEFEFGPVILKSLASAFAGKLAAAIKRR
jgi:hypothetical protein